MKTTRERAVVRILMVVARIIGRTLPDEVCDELRHLSNHLTQAQYEEPSDA